MTTMATTTTMPESKPESVVSTKDLQSSDVVKEVDLPADEFARQHAADRDLFTYAQGQKILRKIDMRLMPILLVTYILRGMDSGAVSYVKTMNAKSPTNILNQLHITSDQFALASTLFTLFYALGELPSNLLFKRTTPRWHYIRIIVLWSLVAGLHAACKNLGGLLAARAFLGLFEAGMAPGAYLHLTYWYRLDEVGPRFAAISAMFNFCNVFVALIAYGLSYVDGRGGLGGWQWVYITIALLGIVLLALVWFCMPEYPDTAKWLTEEERRWIIARLGPGSSKSNDSYFDMSEFKSALSDKSNLAFAVMIMTFNTGLLGLTFWLPTIVSSFGLTKNAAQSLLLNIPPAFLYWVGGIAGAYANDRFSMIPRPIFLTSTLTVTAVSLFLLAYINSHAGQYAIICIVYPISSWAYQTFIPWRAQGIKGSTDAAFIMAFLTGAGQTSGLWTAQIFRSKYAPHYRIPFIICGSLMFLTVLLCWVCWYLTFATEKETRRIQTARRKAGKRDNVILHEDVDLVTAEAERKI